MKIECILQRKGGTVVDMPGQSYHFSPQDDGRHAADVTIESHIERFLAIPEAYRLLRTAESVEPVVVQKPKTEEPPAPVVNADLLGAAGYQEVFTINGKDYPLKAVVARAFADSGVEVENWNELPEETRALKIDMVLDGIADGEIVIDLQEPTQEPAAEPTRAELVEQYVAKFGKRPANTVSIDAIKAKLAE